MNPQQRTRVVRLVNELKAGHRISAEAFARKLKAEDGYQGEAPSSRTLRRDMNFLRDELKAPLEFDRHQNTWYFTSHNWELPYMYLDGDELFAALFSNQVGRYLVPNYLVEGLTKANQVELAASSASAFNIHALQHVVVDGAGKVRLPPETNMILRAFMQRRRLRIKYTSNIGKADTWEIDIHALFLSENVWYARAFGAPVGKAARNQSDTALGTGEGEVVSLPLHRMSLLSVLEHKFERSREIVQGVVDGKLFNCPMVTDVWIHCPPSPEALYISERYSFPNQKLTKNNDCSLDLHIPEVSESQILKWVLQFGGGVTVKAPESLRKQVVEHCKRMLADHVATTAVS